MPVLERKRVVGKDDVHQSSRAKSGSFAPLKGADIMEKAKQLQTTLVSTPTTVKNGPQQAVNIFGQLDMPN